MFQMFQFKAVPTSNQIHLIQTVHEDDEILLNSPDILWYKILYFLPWMDYREPAARYYNALYDFNKANGASEDDDNSPQDHLESKDEAVQRLLLNRATMDKSKPVLHKEEPKPIRFFPVSAHSVAPGKTPDHPGGKKPKCFFALLKSFLGVTLMGLPAEPDMVHTQLTSNLHFARVCGFIPENPKDGKDAYWFQHVPSLRKIQQFDQIMTQYGLWNEIKLAEVRRNIKTKVIQPEEELVGDTTHYHAYSSFEVVTYTDEKGEKQKKSQSKPTKNCRCENRENCPHPWELSDDGAGTIVKSANRKYWGHKASILGLPKQGIPLDTVAIADASTFDGKTLSPHLARLFDQLPEITPWIERVLYDSACSDDSLKEEIKEDFGIELKASLNPRRRGTVTEGLPKGMAKMTPYGNLICKAGVEMEYKGIRYDTEHFIYQAPSGQTGNTVCETCEHKSQCSPISTKGRGVNIPFETLPHINPSDPPMGKRFKAIMTRRPSIERIIKRLKCDLGDDRLQKRGNQSFQAYLDKTMIVFHIMLRN